MSTFPLPLPLNHQTPIVQQLSEYSFVAAPARSSIDFALIHKHTHREPHARTHAQPIGKHMLLTHHSRRCGVMLSPPHLTPHITHSRSPSAFPSLVLYWKFAHTVCTVVQCSGHGAHFAGHVTRRPPPQRPHCTAAKGDGASAAARATLTATATATAMSTASAAAVLSVAQQWASVCVCECVSVCWCIKQTQV